MNWNLELELGNGMHPSIALVLHLTTYFTIFNFISVYVLVVFAASNCAELILKHQSATLSKTHLHEIKLDLKSLRSRIFRGDSF